MSGSPHGSCTRLNRCRQSPHALPPRGSPRLMRGSMTRRQVSGGTIGPRRFWRRGAAACTQTLIRESSCGRTEGSDPPGLRANDLDLGPPTARLSLFEDELWNLRGLAAPVASRRARRRGSSSSVNVLNSAPALSPAEKKTMTNPPLQGLDLLFQPYKQGRDYTYGKKG